MNKRIKHITVNITADEYDALLFMATKDRRRLADMAYILLSDAIDNNITAYVSIKDSKYKKPILKDEDDD